jgi:hypothetical protein
MSTNYNLISTDKAWVTKYFGDDYENEWTLVDTPFFGYEIHIGKRSSGWKPLFQTHNKAYHSVKEMILFFKREEEKFMIFNEYYEELTLEDLIEELINWADKQQVRKVNYANGMLLEDPEGELTIPIDQIKYCDFDPRGREWRSYYWQDEEGYDFMNGEFC